MWDAGWGPIPQVTPRNGSHSVDPSRMCRIPQYPRTHLQSGAA
ncbi:hypothetical protein U9M73_10160 [Paenibacillus phoenicis]|uniref:Uncharacterized protein n=1 Tax=Paenibacillus phoenicis TaxID=554117 RepID=A0ABU5PKC9_9BACL|nr:MULTISPECIES: hypothetical protein [Paenibacillus]MEA3570361.1 hypothetical protein [Paenibacillus phoenicis]